MNIRLKINLFMSIFLIFVVGILTFLNVLTTQEEGAERIESYRAEATAEVKTQLKDLVNIAYTTLDSEYAQLSDMKYLEQFYSQRLRNTLDAGELIIRSYQREVQNNTMTLSEAQREAKAEIATLRYDGGTGYIWINDVAAPFPTMLMHPISPELDGKVLSDEKYNNAQGIKKNLFVAAVDITRGDTRDGFIDYLWPKPIADGVTEEKPKLSYVRRNDDWGWILGTGIYLDDAEAVIKERIKKTVKAMRYDGEEGYFWINDNTFPHPTMIAHGVSPELEGQVMSSEKFDTAQGVGKNFFTAFIEATRAGDNAGYVNYLWKKPTTRGFTGDIAKEVYVRMHKPTGWILGTGIYLDKIDNAVAIKKAEVDEHVSDLILKSVLTALLFIAVSLVGAVLFANSLTKPILRLTEITRSISLGENLDDDIEETARKDEIGQLARGVSRLRTSVKLMMSRMPKS